MSTMAAQTILFDFTVAKERVAELLERHEISEVLRRELELVFPQLELIYQMRMDKGYFCTLTENKEVFITLRIFSQGLITINIEYYLEEDKEPLLSLDVSCFCELQRYDFFADPWKRARSFDLVSEEQESKSRKISTIRTLSLVSFFISVSFPFK